MLRDLGEIEETNEEGKKTLSRHTYALSNIGNFSVVRKLPSNPDRWHFLNRDLTLNAYGFGIPNLKLLQCGADLPERSLVPETGSRSS